MAVITISRQLGSLGNDVACAVAERLGYRMVLREVINQAAQRAGAPEVALATIDELGLLGLKPTRKAIQAYGEAVQQVMNELADQGSIIIVGRGGQVILRGRADALHVRLIAPAGLRAERVAQRHGITLDAAAAQVEASDRSRRDYLKRLYRARLDDPELYHLIINSARFSVAEMANLICRAAALLPAAHTAATAQGEAQTENTNPGQSTRAHDEQESRVE
jgi:cytidylate kinase